MWCIVVLLLCHHTKKKIVATEAPQRYICCVKFLGWFLLSNVWTTWALDVHRQLLHLYDNPNMAAGKVLKKGSIVVIQTVSPRSAVKIIFKLVISELYYKKWLNLSNLQFKCYEQSGKYTCYQNYKSSQLHCRKLNIRASFICQNINSFFRGDAPIFSPKAVMGVSRRIK